MGRRGRKRQLDLESEYWKLLQSGVGTVAACKLLGIDEEKVNVHGSGCSLGHPISASGARMLTTLVNDLRRLGGGYGVATMCAGGGMSGAVLIEV